MTAQGRKLCAVIFFFSPRQKCICSLFLPLSPCCRPAFTPSAAKVKRPALTLERGRGKNKTPPPCRSKKGAVRFRPFLKSFFTFIQRERGGYFPKLSLLSIFLQNGYFTACFRPAMMQTPGWVMLLRCRPLRVQMPWFAAGAVVLAVGVSMAAAVRGSPSSRSMRVASRFLARGQGGNSFFPIRLVAINIGGKISKEPLQGPGEGEGKRH